MSQENRASSLLNRLGRLFGRSPGREQEAGSDEDEAGSLEGQDPADFSALELRDRVVVMMLFDQIVSVEQVEAAWRYWQRMSEEEAPSAFWRVVARLPNVEREAAFAQAARVYAFETLDFNMYDAQMLMRKQRRKFSPEQRRRMVELNVAPVATEYNDPEGGLQWIFATHDPTRPVISRFLSSLNVPNRLCYASESALEDVLRDAFPQFSQHGREKELTLPPDLQVERCGEKENQRIEELARGSSFMDRVFREMEAEGDWSEARSEGKSNAEDQGER